MRTPAIVLATAVGVATYAHNAAATQPTSVTECRRITEPGSYVLARNLSARDFCLQVEADFVTIDLAGFVISGNGVGTGIGVFRGDDPEDLRRGIAVRNGTVQGFDDGIIVQGSAIIESMRVVDNNSVGILCGVGCIVRDSTVELNGGDGMQVFGLITGNVSLNNGGDGILVGIDGLATGNVSLDNRGAGIVGGGQSVVRANVANQNGMQGIAILVSPGNTISSNTAVGNDGPGIEVRCPSNVIGNTAFANAGGDLVLSSGCNNIDNLPPGRPVE